MYHRANNWSVGPPTTLTHRGSLPRLSKGMCSVLQKDTSPITSLRVIINQANYDVGVRGDLCGDRQANVARRESTLSCAHEEKRKIEKKRHGL